MDEAEREEASFSALGGCNSTTPAGPMLRILSPIRLVRNVDAIAAVGGRCTDEYDSLTSELQMLGVEPWEADELSLPSGASANAAVGCCSPRRSLSSVGTTRSNDPPVTAREQVRQYCAIGTGSAMKRDRGT